MKVKVNPILDFAHNEEIAIKRINDMCETLICTLASHTLTDDAYVACADNGEVLVTEKELYAMIDVLNRMTRIINEAPRDCNTMHKVLAVDFIK